MAIQRRWQLVALGCCGLVLTLMAYPAFSQTEAPTAPEIWFQQGQTAYEAQDYPQAIMALESAYHGFHVQDQVLKQAIALSNLSLAHQALGEWEQAERAINESLTLLNFAHAQISQDSIPDLSDAQLRILAPTLDIDGKLWLKQGQSETALKSWRQSEQIYRHLQDEQGIIGSQTNQLQALQALGLYLQADAIASDLDRHLTQVQDPLLRARVLRGLGNTYRSVGKLRSSEDALKQSLAAAQDIPEEVSATLLSLGNTYLALGNREKERQITTNRQGVLPWQCLPIDRLPPEAVTHYEEAFSTYKDAIRQTQNPQQAAAAQLNQLTALLELGRADAATQQLWTEIRQALSNQRFSSRFGVYAQIKLAKQGACFKQAAANETLDWEPIIELLKQALVMATELNDSVAVSQASGNLGGLYEYFSSLEAPPAKAARDDVWREAALTLTEQALIAAQPSELPDIAYQWQWQLARLNKASGQIEVAITNYRQTAATLQSVRNNLLTIDSEVQFSFRDNVEPVYRELADLLLRPDEPSQSALEEVISLIDNIQLAELESFLQCNLAGTIELTRAEIPNTSAVLYTVLLADRLEVIAQVPGETNLLHHRVRKSYTDIETTLSGLRRELEKDFITSDGEALTAEVYEWLLQPQEAILERSGINTLVFVLDSALRNIPPAALRDAEGRYLVEKYAIALTPRLQLQTPQPLQPSALDVLFFGLAEINDPFRQRFGPLPFVNAEAEQVKAAIASRIFLDGEFTQAALDAALQAKPAKIIHFATHGEFSSDPEKTFILAWDQPINSQELNALLRDTPANFSLELLVLSACKTATGDNRATLGLAGLALQAGAQSTVASLWTVNDEATADFIGAFYQALTNRDRPTSRAEALRIAQLALLQKYKAPGRWAPFVLVGNWL